MSDSALITIQPQPTGLPLFTVGAEAIQLKESALSLAALIGHVRTPAENSAAVEAQKEIKRVCQLFERQRKKLKEPLIEAGRQLDRVVQAELVELDKELGRLSELTTEFQLAEQRRIREEQEAQQRELARIEAEKQAELKRIADEQARIERDALKARLEAEAAVKFAANKAQREAAAQAMADAEAKRKEAEKAAALAAEQTRLANESAAAKAYSEGKPITASRESGQVVKTDWDIQVVNPYDLAKYHPDCVKIEPLITPIKAALNDGREVKGIVAKKKLTTSVRPGSQKVIEV